MSTYEIKLNNGICVPAIGLGTWRSPADITTQAVKDAIEVGFRHIDTAPVYGNEPDVGLAIEEMIKKGVVQREDLYIVTKLWNTCHRPDCVRRAITSSLTNLRIDYLDNYLIHWPTAFVESDEMYPRDKAGKTIFADVDFTDTWRAMESLVDEGLCRSIGLSNFNQKQIERILKIARITPSVLQVECHPYLCQKDLINFCRDHEIVITAYSPLGSPHSPHTKPWDYALMENPKIIDISKRINRTPAQLLIRYQIQKGNIVIPRSITREHMVANLEAINFKLDDKDIRELDSLDCNGRFNLMKAALGHPNYPFCDNEADEII